MQPSNSKPDDSQPGLDVRSLLLAVACLSVVSFGFHVARLYLQRTNGGSSAETSQSSTALSGSSAEPGYLPDTGSPAALSGDEAPDAEAPDIAQQPASSPQPPQDPAEFSVSLGNVPYGGPLMSGSNKLEITLTDGGPLTLEEVLINGHADCSYSLVKERNEIQCVEEWNRRHPASVSDASNLSALKKSCGEHSVFAGGNNSLDKYNHKGRILNTGDQWSMFFNDDPHCGDRVVQVDLDIDQGGSEYTAKYLFENSPDW